MTRLCQVIGCDGKHKARGMCAAHYAVWRYGYRAPLVLPDRRYGVPLGPRPVEAVTEPSTGPDGKVVSHAG